MRTLLFLILLAAPGLAQEVRLQIDVDREGRRLDPETREPWSGAGPYVFDSTRRLRFQAGEVDTTRSLSLGRKLERAGFDPRSTVVVVASDALDPLDLPPVLDRLMRAGWKRFEIVGEGAGAREGRAWLGDWGPRFLRVGVARPGDPIEATTGEPWYGVGRRRFVDRVLSYRLDDGDPAQGWRSLQELLLFDPELDLVVQVDAGLEIEDLVDLAARLEELQVSNLTWWLDDDEDERWLRPDSQVFLLDVEWDGRTYRLDRQLLDANHVRESDDLDPLREELASMAALMRKRNGLPDEQLLLRVHPSTPFRHVQRLLLICGRSEYRIWKVDLAIAGVEGHVPVWLPVDVGHPDGPELTRLPVTVTVERRGARLNPDRTPWDGQGPFLYDESRTLAYQFAVDRTNDVKVARALMRRVAEVEDLHVVVDPHPDITCGDLYPLLRAANAEGLGLVFLGY